MKRQTNNRGNSARERRKKILLQILRRYFSISMLFFSLVFAAAIYGDEPDKQYGEIKFEHLSIEHGLSQSSVFCILQDKRGFMWFGTEHGLNRYDGHTFKLYNYDPKNPYSLSHNMVVSLYEDDSGRLWVGTWGGGLNRLDLKTEEFKVYKNIPDDSKSLNCNDVWSIYEDKECFLWFGTDKGLYKYEKEEDKFTPYLVSPGNSEDDDRKKKNKINTIYQDTHGTIWVGAENGLHKYERDEDDFNKIKFKSDSTEFNLQKIRVLHGDGDKDLVLWLGTETGLYKFNQEKGKSIYYAEIIDCPNELKGKQISSVNRDSKGITWVGTQGQGLYILEPSLERLFHYKNDPTKAESLSNDDIRAIYEDKSGLIWIGTFSGGINKYDPQRKKFTLYRNIPVNTKSLSNSNVAAICKCKNGGAWIGTRGGGVNYFNPVNEEFTHYEIPDNVPKNENRNKVRAIREDDEPVVWAGTTGAGLYRKKPGEKNFGPYTIEQNKYPIGPETYILTIYLDKKGVLWIGTMSNGLFKIEKNRKEYTNYRHNPKKKQSLSDDSVYSILEDSSGTLWIGSGYGGLNKFDFDGEQEIFTHYQPDEKKPDSISHNFILAIYEDNKKDFWIGTNGGGLNKFNKEKETFTAFTTKYGLPDNVIYDILEDNDGHLWLSTNKGLSRFNKKEKKFRNYSVRDGLQAFEFNRGAAWKSKNGKMFFGGTKGLNVFDPNELKSKDRSTSPEIMITSFKKRGQEFKLPTSISEIDEIELSYKDTSITFEFAALIFPDPERNKYAYKLEPVDREWIELGDKHSVDLINLKPGDYTFRVKGSNNDGAWNEKGTSLKIKIKPPYWQAWWFISILVLVIGSLILSFVKWRINLKEMANRQLKKEIDERKRAEELYRNLVETSPDAITLSDAVTEKIIMANRQTAQLLGYISEEEIKNKVKNIFDIFSQNDHERAKKNAEKTIKSGIHRNTEYTLLSKDETPIAAELSTALIKDADGNPKYFLSIARDIRKRKEEERQKRMQQEKLVQIDRMASLGTLVSGVAHELNNPLASIKMNAESFSKVWRDVVYVLDKHYDEHKEFKLAKMPYNSAKAKLEELITGLLESSLRIETIINVLRDFSRPEGSYSRQPIDINKVIKSSIELTHNMHKNATRNFDFNPARNLPSFEGNFLKLEQVFVNLIQNACQALANNIQKIDISTTHEIKKKHILVKVEDEGKGIEKKKLKYVFDPFFTTKRESGGTGLGLSISSQIIKEHGGTLTVESTVGKGTTIIIKLPVNSIEKKK